MGRCCPPPVPMASITCGPGGRPGAKPRLEVGGTRKPPWTPSGGFMTLGSAPGKYARNFYRCRTPSWGGGFMAATVYAWTCVQTCACDVYVDGGICLCGNMHGHYERIVCHGHMCCVSHCAHQQVCTSMFVGRRHVLVCGHVYICRRVLEHIECRHV